MSFLDDAVGHFSEEQSIALGQIDIAIADVLVSWEECDVEMDERQYLLLVNHMRWAFATGYQIGWAEGRITQRPVMTLLHVKGGE